MKDADEGNWKPGILTIFKNLAKTSFNSCFSKEPFRETVGGIVLDYL